MKTWGIKLIFLPLYIQGSFLQVDSNTLGVHGQAYPKHPKYKIFLQYLMENLKDEVDFCLQINIEVLF